LSEAAYINGAGLADELLPPTSQGKATLKPGVPKRMSGSDLI
jgi:hypothetical protein